MAGTSTGKKKGKSSSSSKSSSRNTASKSSPKTNTTSGKRSSANRRTSSSARSGSGSYGTRSKSGGGQRAASQQENTAVRRDIILIVMFAVTVFLFLCNFMSLGLIGTFFSNLMFGLAGSMAYVLPILIFAIYLYYFLAGQKDPYAVSRMMGVAGLFLIVMVLAELVSVDLSAQEGFDPVGIYTRSAQNHSGGGLIGGAIAFALYSLLRTVGTVMVLIVLVVACVYVIGQRSYLEMFRDRAMDARLAREERIAEEERYREEHPEEFEDDYEEEYEEDAWGVPEGQTQGRSHYEETRERYQELRREREQRRREKEEERRRQEELARLHAEEEEASRILNKRGVEADARDARADSSDVSSWSADLSADPDAPWGEQPQVEIDIPWNFSRAAEEAAPLSQNPEAAGGTQQQDQSGSGNPAGNAEGFFPSDDPGLSVHSADSAYPEEESRVSVEEPRRTSGYGYESDDLHEIRPEDFDERAVWEDSFPEETPSERSAPGAGAAYVSAAVIAEDTFLPDADAFEESGREDPGLSEVHGGEAASCPDDPGTEGTAQSALSGTHPDLVPPDEDSSFVPEGTQTNLAYDEEEFAGDEVVLPAPDSSEEMVSPGPAAEPGAFPEDSRMTEALRESGEASDRAFGQAREQKENTREREGDSGTVPVHSERDGTESEINRTLAQQGENNEEAASYGSATLSERNSGGGAAAGSVSSPAKSPAPFCFPPIELLRPGAGPSADSDEELRRTAHTLQTTLQNFGVSVTITDISQGPSVTRYELLPEMGVKVSKIVSLTDDIKLALAATDIRIEAPIPGKSAIGIEVPNREAQPVMLRDIIDTPEFRAQKSRLSFAVGKDIAGKPVYSDIAKMPHVLIAGATGSGKSVCINTIIISILYHARPDEVKFIMIDPKVVELSVYNGIPHLLIPVVTDPQKATSALNWAVAEMEARYRAFADARVREIKAYNTLVRQMDRDGTNEEQLKYMPQIVVIVDELADLMMVAKSDVETAICRLAQLARAAGIHLIIATQRPSVDVITGLIKANMPSRIAFRVSSGVDSRTILDMNGAEKLLGKGDMLFFPQGLPKPNRVQGGFVSDDEVNEVVQFLQQTCVVPEEEDEKRSEMLKAMESGAGTAVGAAGATSASSPEPDVDELFASAGSFIIEKNNASIGLLQRRYRIGFNRAARIMDQLCDAGVVGDSEGTKSRTILMTPAEFSAYCSDNGIPLQDPI